jgi:hypothetical protein
LARAPGPQGHRTLRRRGPAPPRPHAGPTPEGRVSIDDATSVTDKGTHALEAVDWTFDPAQHKNCKGAVHVALRLHVGPYSYTFTWRPYLRVKTVHHLNKQRPEGQRLKFRSKLRLAQEMLEELLPYLPQDAAVYVLFDRWYASADLIRFIRRQGWHVIGAVKSNRKLNGTRLDVHDKRLERSERMNGNAGKQGIPVISSERSYGTCGTRTCAWPRRAEPPPRT